MSIPLFYYILTALRDQVCNIAESLQKEHGIEELGYVDVPCQVNQEIYSKVL